jgi:outer membrane protein TolC
MNRLTPFVSIPALLAACATYQAAPLDPKAQAGRYNARSVSDSGLMQFRVTAGESASSTAWRPADLALAALYFVPALDEARGRYHAADAGEITAGARPRPGIAGSVEHNLGHGNEESPWGLELTGTFVIELGGKRGARVAIAQARTLEAESALREAAWNLALDARDAALAATGAEAGYRGATTEQRLTDSLLPRLEARYRDGSVSPADLAQFRSEVQAAHLTTQQSESEWHQAQARAAGAAGLPVEQLRRVSLTGESAEVCGGLPSVPRDSLQLLALGSRWSVAEALAAYQVAEGELRLEIARQRPDLNLGPGLFFDHGITRFLINFVLPTLPGGNTGPIREAEARRRTAAAHVAAVQEAVLVEMDEALDECDGAAREIRAADSLQLSTQTRSSVVYDSYQRGEVGLLEVGLANLEAVRAVRAQRIARQRGDMLRARLERAVGVWASEGPARWPDVTAQPVRADSKEAP